jgi:RHS repeat-associated protein
VQEKDGATIKANLLTGLGIDEVFRRTQGATTSDVLPDALGSSVALSDSTKAITTQYTYAPYGTTTQTGPANDNSQKFTGREDDGTTGLYYYRARYYSPKYSRFLAEDPIDFAGGPNIYAYVGGNPFTFRDPLGLERPYDERFGPTDANCAHYQSDAGGLLYWICHDFFGDSPWGNCSRKCLKDYYPGRYGGPWIDYAFWLIPQHPVCWIDCTRDDDRCKQ